MEIKEEIYHRNYGVNLIPAIPISKGMLFVNTGKASVIQDWEINKIQTGNSGLWSVVRVSRSVLVTGDQF